MNNYRSRLINFTEVLFPAYRKGEALEYLKPELDVWYHIDPANDDIVFRHYLCADDKPDVFWDLRIAPKPEPRPDDQTAVTLAKARTAMSRRDRAGLVIELTTALARGEKIEFYDTDERVWREIDFDDEDIDCLLKAEASYRIAPKPEPKMPDAPVFWVRHVGLPSTHMLVTHVDLSRGEIGTLKGCWLIKHMSEEDQFCWSPDRKNWFDFYGRPVSP